MPDLPSVTGVLTVVGLAAAAWPATARADALPASAPMCESDYADDLQSMSPAARAVDAQNGPDYVFCVRNTAVYECLAYAPDGTVAKKKTKVTAHGTAFAYKQDGGDTLLLTNEHVAEWPAVTDEDHPAEDVPLGCKKVSEALKIVDDEGDAYERDDIPLAKVVTDPRLDAAILRAHTSLPVLPWKVGRSAALRARTAVEVRGFPLGILKATNAGKVVSAYDHDDYKDWDHDDFVVDALVSEGNSGSPVLAVSCRTREPELVGMFHAHYTGGTGLNVVVGIDQLRDFMTTLKRSSSPAAAATAPLGKPDRERVIAGVKAEREPFFPFGPLAAAVRVRDDGAILWEVFSPDFPTKTHPVLVIEDLAVDGDFGAPGRVWFGKPRGLRAYLIGELDADTQAFVHRALEALRRDALAAFAYADALKDPATSREHFDETTRRGRTLEKRAAAHKDLALFAVESADRLGPKGSDTVVSLNDAFVPPASGARGKPAAASADKKKGKPKPAAKADATDQPVDKPKLAAPPAKTAPADKQK
jgi:serine protease Do